MLFQRVQFDIRPFTSSGSQSMIKNVFSRLSVHFKLIKLWQKIMFYLWIMKMQEEKLISHATQATVIGMAKLGIVAVFFTGLCLVIITENWKWHNAKSTSLVVVIYHDASLVVRGGTRSCHNRNRRCHQRQQVWHLDNSRWPGQYLQWHYG